MQSQASTNACRLLKWDLDAHTNPEEIFTLVAWLIGKPIIRKANFITLNTRGFVPRRLEHGSRLYGLLSEAYHNFMVNYLTR
jgi:hypothetical protein